MNLSKYKTDNKPILPAVFVFDMAFYPLRRINVLMQSHLMSNQVVNYAGTFKTLNFKSLFTGFTPIAVLSLCSGGALFLPFLYPFELFNIYAASYQGMKNNFQFKLVDILRNYAQGNNWRGYLGYLAYIVTAGSSLYVDLEHNILVRSLFVAMAYPIDVVRKNYVVQYLEPEGTRLNYQAVAKMIHEQFGAKGFYRGIFVSPLFWANLLTMNYNI
jgi:hypothetical protein